MSICCSRSVSISSFDHLYLCLLFFNKSIPFLSAWGLQWCYILNIRIRVIYIYIYGVRWPVSMVACMYTRQNSCWSYSRHANCLRYVILPKPIIYRYLKSWLAGSPNLAGPLRGRQANWIACSHPCMLEHVRRPCMGVTVHGALGEGLVSDYRWEPLAWGRGWFIVFTPDWDFTHRGTAWQNRGAFLTRRA